MLTSPAQQLISNAVTDARRKTLGVSTQGALDLISKELADEARGLGLDRWSIEYAATWLLACGALDRLRQDLLRTDSPDKEIAAKFLGDAIWRMKVIGTWHLQWDPQSIGLRKVS